MEVLRPGRIRLLVECDAAILDHADEDGVRLAKLDQLLLCSDVDVVVIVPLRAFGLLALHIHEQFLVLTGEELDFLGQRQDGLLHLVLLELPLHAGRGHSRHLRDVVLGARHGRKSGLVLYVQAHISFR